MFSIKNFTTPQIWVPILNALVSIPLFVFATCFVMIACEESKKSTQKLLRLLLRFENASGDLDCLIMVRLYLFI